MQTVSKKISTAELTKISMCVALCCISANIFFPLPFTPAMVTALTIVLSLTAYILPPKQTFTVVAVYLLLGIAGLPVFAGTGGIGRLVSPAGGFYLAWLLAYPLLSYLKGAEINFKRYVLMNFFVAMPVTYAGGLISMALILEIDIWQAATMAVFPFIFSDVLKTCAAAFLGVKLNSALKIQE